MPSLPMTLNYFYTRLLMRIEEITPVREDLISLGPKLFLPREFLMLKVNSEVFLHIITSLFMRYLIRCEQDTIKRK